MGQTTSGIRAVLSRPWAYRALQSMVGASNLRRVVVGEHVRPTPGMRILDVGCGTGEILDHLPLCVEYTGVDLNSDYIEAATQRFGSRGRFLTRPVEEMSLEERGQFDVLLAVGLLHHLDDSAAIRLFEMARSTLAPGGRLISIDCCYAKEQSSLARILISRDRGQNVRFADDYRDLAEKVFSDLETFLRGDLLAIPYTHLIMECRR